MLVSLRWLLALCPVDADPGQVADRLTARGLTVDAIDADSLAGDDVVLDIDVPANRPDCLGHRGIARELAAAFSVALRAPRGAPAADGKAITEAFSVAIEDVSACARFTAGLVRNVRVGPSPEWVCRRLEACGLRSINNVVDASNLVLLELGQPVHFYDAATLAESRILVRRARSGERLRTLDDVEHNLPEGAVVIADGSGPIGLAGIMGGATTEICETTRDVLVEAAWFEPRSIRRTANALSLSTDASQRFERGCDPQATVLSQDLAAALLAELADGAPAPGRIDVDPAPPAPNRLVLREERLARVLGYAPRTEEITGAFAALSIEHERPDGGRIEVRVPSWRVDLEREADLIEEVARHVGYDAIPATVPAAGGVPPAGSTHPLAEPTRDVLAHLGFHEAFNYAMVGPGEDDPYVGSSDPPAIALANPISDPLSRLRRSIVPGLVSASIRNVRRGQGDVRLFEVGRVFLAEAVPGAFPRERLRAGIAWAGARRPPHWSEPAEGVATVDIAGIVERVLRSLRPGGAFERRPAPGVPGLHPGHAVAWTAPDGRELARAGAIHPDVRARLDLDSTLFVAEIDLDEVRAMPGTVPRFRSIPRVPAVSRDLSLVLETGVPYRDALRALERVPAPAPCTFETVDRYVGAPLADGEVSVTVRVILHPQERTLTDEVTEAFRAALIEVIGATKGVRLRV